jgi:hypothetical protein
LGLVIWNILTSGTAQQLMKALNRAESLQRISLSLHLFKGSDSLALSAAHSLEDTSKLASQSNSDETNPRETHSEERTARLDTDPTDQERNTSKLPSFKLDKAQQVLYTSLRGDPSARVSNLSTVSNSLRSILNSVIMNEWVNHALERGGTSEVYEFDELESEVFFSLGKVFIASCFTFELPIACSE